MARLRTALVWGLENSRDPVWKVGAMLVAADKRASSFGYNGLVRGVPETDANWAKPRKLELVRHAEENALSWATFPKVGSELFVPLKPCSDCLGMAINNGVTYVAWFRDRENEANPAYYGESWWQFAAMITIVEYEFDDITLAILAAYGLQGTMKYKRR